VAVYALKQWYTACCTAWRSDSRISGSSQRQTASPSTCALAACMSIHVHPYDWSPRGQDLGGTAGIRMTTAMLPRCYSKRPSGCLAGAVVVSPAVRHLSYSGPAPAFSPPIRTHPLSVLDDPAHKLLEAPASEAVTHARLVLMHGSVYQPHGTCTHLLLLQLKVHAGLHLLRRDDAVAKYYPRASDLCASNCRRRHQPVPGSSGAIYY
jgi:hypothetical protein